MPRYDVHRSIQIDAAAEKVFETVADFNTWTTWSPWLCAEPNADVNVTENASGVGAIYSWKGELVGEGALEHRELQPNRLVDDEIRFVKPFRSQSRVSFELTPANQGTAGAGTEVTWRMQGSLPWYLFWMRAQMEIFIGMDYERGLKMLKELIETGQVLSKIDIRGVESVGPLQMAGVRKTCSFGGIGASMKTAFAEASRKLPEHDLPINGQPISVYHALDMKAQTFDYTSGFMIPESASPIPDELSSWTLPTTDALRVRHIGSYENLGNAWSAANQYARYKKLRQSKVGAFEIYKNDPQETSPADLHTEIFLPLK